MPSPAIPMPSRSPKRRVRAIYVPPLSALNLSEKDRNKQAESIRHDSYTISRLLGRNILQALRDDNKTGMKESVISFGICADKVLSGVESSGIDLHIPAALIDKFALALNVKPSVPLPVDTKQLP